uniref:Ig-like domain-containing protein n=1 Tax=Lynx canadensis TaxID=61383 RepID=A0A667HVX7_LYNCA
MSGRPSNLTCSVPWACAWGTPPIFSWTSAALASLGPKTHLSSVLTLTPRLQDHGTDLTCQVTLPGTGVTTMRTIHLNVSCENRARATRIPDGVLRAVGWGVRAWDLGCRVLACGFYLYKKTFNVYFMLCLKKHRVQVVEGPRERETQNPKQAPGSELSAHSLMQGSNS